MNSQAVTWEVLNPIAEREVEFYSLAPRPPDLVGKKIMLFWNGKPGGDVLLGSVAKLLQERFSNIEFEQLRLFLGVGDENIRRMAQYDAVVGAIGD